MTSPDLFLPSGPTGIASSLLSGRPVSDGEPVNAAVTNRLPRVNSGNMAYLHELLKRLHNRSGEFLYDVPIADDVVPGDFVYLDGAARVFAKGLSKTVLRDGVFIESESAQVWGVVVRVGNKEADLCTSGLCVFRTETAAYADYPDAGARYLSDRIPGEPTPKRHGPEKCLGYLIGVKASGEVQFFVRPHLTVDQRVHRHRSIELANVPAGSCDREVPGMILQVRPDLAGWMPADHAVFAGKVLPGALCGYNPAFLYKGWPLRYASNAGLRWQRHVTETDDPLLASVPPEFYAIDDTTIWWLSDVYLPWNSRTGYTDGRPLDIPDSAYGTRMWLDYIDLGLSDSLVASLRTAPGSGLRLEKYPFGGPAIHGDLLLDFELAFRRREVGDVSGYAVKGIDKFDLTCGPVVSGLKIDSSRLQVIHSDHCEKGYHFGRLVLGDPSGKIGRELPFEAVHLQGVEESVEREAIGLAFPTARESSFLARIVVPCDRNFDRFDVTLQFGILVTRSGNIAADALKLSYRVIAAPPGNNTITQAFPQSGLNELACDFSVRNSQYSQGYYTAESARFTVTPGDVLLVKMARTPPDNFNDRIILLRKSAILWIADS